MSGRKPTRDFDALSITYHPPGAQKEKVKEKAQLRNNSRTTDHRQPRTNARPYAELRAASAFAFLDSASLPEDLIAGAAQRGLPAMALVDTNGVYGAPRFYSAAKKAGVRALVGSELILGDNKRLTLLVENHTGYKNLCKLITAGSANHPKGHARFTWEQVEKHAEGLRCLTRADEVTLHKISGIFKGRTHVELQRHSRRDEEHDNVRLVDLARRMHLPLVATNGVRYATPAAKELHDVLTCIREGRNVDNAGRLLGINRERHIKSAAEMAKLFADLPEAIDGAWDLANALQLHARRPRLPVPRLSAAARRDQRFVPAQDRPGTSATTRYRPLTARAQAQIERELNMIEKLDLAGYFLIVWDIVHFCTARRSSCRAAARRPTARSATPSASPPSIRWGWSCSSSASCPRSAASGRTSISICRPAISARRSSSTSTRSTASTARR